MSIKKHVVVISASPKTTGDSVSGWLAARAGETMKDDSLKIDIVRVRESIVKKKTAEAYAEMAGADALIVIFPLYIFCLPGLLTRFLQDYNDYLKVLPSTKKPLIYAVVNCGFPEPDINEEAVRVIKSFSEKIGGLFRFAVMIGGGGMLLGAQESPMVKKMTAEIDNAFTCMKHELTTGQIGPAENISVRLRFPRRLYFFAASLGWVSEAKKFHLKKKDLYARPYISPASRP